MLSSSSTVVDRVAPCDDGEGEIFIATPGILDTGAIEDGGGDDAGSCVKLIGESVVASIGTLSIEIGGKLVVLEGTIEATGDAARSGVVESSIASSSGATTSGELDGCVKSIGDAASPTFDMFMWRAGSSDGDEDIIVRDGNCGVVEDDAGGVEDAGEDGAINVGSMMTAL